MKKVLIFDPKRFYEIPNIYFKSMVNKIFNTKNDFIKIKCNETNYKKILNSHSFDAVFMPRGYGLNEFSDFKLNKNVFKICFMDDIHYHNEETRKKLHKMFKYSDIIMLTYYNHFLNLKEFEKYHKKACFFPFSSLFLDKKRASNDRIFLSGRASSSYPFRRFLINNYRKSPLVDIVDHPGYFGLKHDIIGKKYHDIMSEYTAAIATTAKSPINYTVLKYFEIPSSGVIPIFQKTTDLSDLGFVENIHYIAINENNFKKILNLKYLENKSKIKNEAYHLVEKNHTLQNRVDLFFKILEKESPVDWILL